MLVLIQILELELIELHLMLMQEKIGLELVLMVAQDMVGQGMVRLVF